MTDYKYVRIPRYVFTILFQKILIDDITNTRIGPKSDVRRRTRAMSGKVFYGRMEGRTAEKKRCKNFVLGSPSKLPFCHF